MSNDLNALSTMVDQKILNSFRKALTAATVEELLCWLQIMALWEKAKMHIEQLRLRMLLDPVFPPMIFPPDLQAQMEGIRATIRAAVISSEKPEAGTRLAVIADAWRVAGNAYFAAKESYERNDPKAAQELLDQADMSADGAREAEESAGYRYVEPKPEKLEVPARSG